MRFEDWQDTRSPLPEIDVGGFWFNTLGASLHELDDHLVMSVLIDESDGMSVVLMLDPHQEAGIRQLLPMREETWTSVHDWLRGLDLADNEVIGRTTNTAFVAFALLADGDSPQE